MLTLYVYCNLSPGLADAVHDSGYRGGGICSAEHERKEETGRRWVVPPEPHWGLAGFAGSVGRAWFVSAVPGGGGGVRGMGTPGTVHVTLWAVT